MSFRAITDWLVYLAVRIFICIIQAMRMETCHGISRFLAWLACDVFRIRYQVVDENIQHVYPELTSGQRRAFARRMWEHLFLMVCEVAHVPRKIHTTNFRQYFSFHKKRELVHYILENRPTVLVTGHFGNFEVAGYMAGLLGFTTHTIARPLDNPYLNEFVNKFRGAHGQFLLPKEGSANQVNAVLESGGTLSLLGDQHAGHRGCWVEFLGRPASSHKALALFTLTSNAPMLVVYTRRTGGPMQFEMGCSGIADPACLDEQLAGVKPLTQWYNHELERIIRADPEQYWWVHRRWKDKRKRRRRAQRKTPPASQAAA